VRFEATTPKELTFIAKIETRDDLDVVVERIHTKRELFNIIRDKI
jgi:hypothetical protein